MTVGSRSPGILVAVNSRGQRWGYREIAVYLAGQGRPVVENTLMTYKSKGELPPDDATDPDTPDRPKWWSMTIMEWDSRRVGKGAPGHKRGTRTARQPKGETE